MAFKEKRGTFKKDLDDKFNKTNLIQDIGQEIRKILLFFSDSQIYQICFAWIFR